MNDDLDTLIAAWLDGRLTPEEHSRLENQLLNDPAARKRLRSLATLDVSLRDWAIARALGDAWSGQPSPQEPGTPVFGFLNTSWLSLARVMGILVCIAVVAGGIRLALRRDSRSSEVPLARLTDLAAATWPADTAQPEVGTPLGPGPLRLESGTAQVTFQNGAVVALTGPAEMELITPQRAFLRYGTIVSYVPPQAHGFTVLSPHGQLVDLGTEFAMQVEPAGRTDVHVLTGEVQVAASALGNGNSRRLTTGYAARLEATAGTVQSRITQQPLLLDHFETPDTPDLNGNLSQRQQGSLAPVHLAGLDADAAAVIRQGRLVIPFEGRKGRKDPVSRVVLDNDFTELVGRRYTIAFKARLPEMGSIRPNHWLAFVLEDGPRGQTGPSMSLAYGSKVNFGILLSTDWQVGVRGPHGVLPSTRVFARSEAAGPYQVMLRVDETVADGPRLDLEVNGIPVITGLQVPFAAGRHLGFHTWVKEHSDGRGWASIDDLCVSAEDRTGSTSYPATTKRGGTE
jgi:hypothetical protein